MEVLRGMSGISELLYGWLLACKLKMGHGQRGATAAEYALILALVAVMLIGSLTRLGQALTNQLEGIIDKISGAN
jgi:Flp pilus assembly pilin Flp